MSAFRDVLRRLFGRHKSETPANRLVPRFEAVASPDEPAPTADRRPQATPRQLPTAAVARSDSDATEPAAEATATSRRIAEKPGKEALAVVKPPPTEAPHPPPTASRVEPPAVAPVAPKPRGTRRLHLGMDFGTCWSKLVFRDYEAPQPRCMVIRPGREFDGDGGFRIPSGVVVEDGRMYFGWSGQQLALFPTAASYTSPKMHAAFGDYAAGVTWPALPQGTSAEDLCALVVGYLLEIGRSAAEEYARRLPGSPDPKLSMTMGVPMSMLDSRHLADKFLQIARIGYELHRGQPKVVTAGMSLEAARDALARAKAIVASRPAVQDRRDWVRSEAEAGLLWAFQSPDTAEGLYGCVDIGAGTTDVSFFRITPQWQDGYWTKRGLAFYSAESDRPGVDAIDDVLLAHGLGARLGLIRGHEVTLLSNNGLSSSVQIKAIVDGSFRVYQKAWRDAYDREKGVSRWKDYRLFVMGGGANLNCLRNRVCGPVWEQLGARKPTNPGSPTDLLDWDGRTPVWNDDAMFLLVAYGLSFFAPDTPPAEAPNELAAFEPLQPRRDAMDQDELYPK